jgi:hypothetical protein
VGIMTGKVLEHSIHNLEDAIHEAVPFLPKNFNPRHEHSKRCYRVLKHILHDNEYTVIEAKQSKLKSISPTRLVATNQRIIFVKPSFWSLWTGHNIFSSTKYESIPYGNIVNISLFTGMVFSTLSIHLNTSANNGEDEVHDLKTCDAEAMFVFLEKMADALTRQTGENIRTESPSTHDSEIIYMDMETSRKFLKYKGSKLLWVGSEPLEYVADKLDISKDAIIKMDVGKLMHLDKQESGKLNGCILVWYTDDFASYISKHLRKTYGTVTYVLSGGIGDQLKKILEIT